MSEIKGNGIQVANFMLNLIAEKQFESIEDLVYHLNNDKPEFANNFEQYIAIEDGWGEELVLDLEGFDDDWDVVGNSEELYYNKGLVTH